MYACCVGVKWAKGVDGWMDGCLHPCMCVRARTRVTDDMYRPLPIASCQHTPYTVAVMVERRVLPEFVPLL